MDEHDLREEGALWRECDSPECACHGMSRRWLGNGPALAEVMVWVGDCLPGPVSVPPELREPDPDYLDVVGRTFYPQPSRNAVWVGRVSRQLWRDKLGQTYLLQSVIRQLDRKIAMGEP